MPELPEVEVTRRSLLPHLVGKKLLAGIARRADLRRAIPPEIGAHLPGKLLADIRRRGKYLLFHFPAADGWLIVHLGMSGSLRLVAPETPPGAHDHVDLVFAHTCLRFRDPRRFGLFAWQAGADPGIHPCLSVLGIEPLSESFSAAWLVAQGAGRQQPIKAFLMDARRVVGIGNIYAAESLFRAGISPFRPTGSLTLAEAEKLVGAVRSTLAEALAAGGSSVRDYVHSDGGAGSFQLRCAVYGRAGQPCPRCGQRIRQQRQAGRSTFFCPACQV